MFCKVCGTMFTEDEAFCSQCGEPTGMRSAVSEETEMPETEMFEPEIPEPEMPESVTSDLEIPEPEMPEPAMPEEDGRPRPSDVILRQCCTPRMLILAVYASIASIAFVMELFRQQPQSDFVTRGHLYDEDVWRTFENVVPYIWHYGSLIALLVTMAGVWMMVYPSKERLSTGAWLAGIGTQLFAGIATLFMCYKMISLIAMSIHVGPALSIYLSMSKEETIWGWVMMAAMPLLPGLPVIVYFRSLSKMFDAMCAHMKPNVSYFTELYARKVAGGSLAMAAAHMIAMAIRVSLGEAYTDHVVILPQVSYCGVMWIFVWLCMAAFAWVFSKDIERYRVS